MLRRYRNSNCSTDGLSDDDVEERRCGSIDIRNAPNMMYGQNGTFSKTHEITRCTVIEGDFGISLITGNNYTDEQFLTFPYLREITGYLLVFQVNGLRSLGRIFPNLRIIGGQSMLMHYSLIVYQNYDLEDVGLTKLSVIKNGGVRITQNTKLCETRFIDWRLLTVGPVNDIRTEEEQAMGRCTQERVCDPHGQQNCSNVGGYTSCWSSKVCQKKCEHVVYEDGSIGPGCDPFGQKCHPKCLGGCTRVNDTTACHSCRRVAHKGECVDKCPKDLFELLERRCVTEQECANVAPRDGGGNKRRMWKAIEGKCHYECPAKYRQDPNDPYKCIECEDYCPNICEGDKTIDTIANALELKNCDVVAGYIEIDLRVGMDVVAAEKLTEAFGRIREIEKYLTIRFTPTFMNLYMFKNLQKIHGKQLYGDRYALVVIENVNLRQTFDYKNKTMEILNGTVMFHNNRMLCPQKINDFIKAVNLTDKVDENDVSSLSNGERAICEDHELEVTITDVYPYGFVLRWPAFNTTNMDHRKFLGYTIYYKKVDAPNEEMSIDDDRSACSDSWTMEFSPVNQDDQSPFSSKEKRFSGGFISGSKITPDTWFAYYVQTRLVNHRGARNAISKIYFVKTSFGTPDPPRITHIEAKSSNQVVVTWNPPEKPHGQITYYQVKLKKNPRQEEVQGDGCTVPHHGDQQQLRKPANKPFQDAIRPKKNQETCSREGCCSCSATNEERNEPAFLHDEQDEHNLAGISADDIFENKIQDHVFKQRCEFHYDPMRCPPPGERRSHRRKHHHHAPAATAPDEDEESDDSPENTLRRRLKRRITEAPDAEDKPTTKAPETKTTSKDPPNYLGVPDIKNDTRLIEYFDVKRNITKGTFTIEPDSDAEMFTFNMTGTHLTVKNLIHYTSYTIMILACQNVSVEGASCSTMHDVKIVKTLPEPSKDAVDLDALVIRNETHSRNRVFWWPHPKDPNGAVLAYSVKIGISDSDVTPLHVCVNKTTFDETRGAVFRGIPDGVYYLQVETISMSSISKPEIRLNALVMITPSFWTWKIVLAICAGVVVVGVLGLFGFRRYYNYYFGKHMQEYWKQTVATNPDYLSQMEVYAPDEWEIPRNVLSCHEEIGRGTFGKVYRGSTNNFTTVNGITFSECAIKTVVDNASMSDRVHFLLEGSVMKKFNTTFIVQLYGIVSDGTPAYVVMELMAKGNLRDFLRAHRPGAEENLDNRPPPTPAQLFLWAAQIADGMAYLQSIKFCHRDLAARNCMVHENECVKIGDFGMARDIYYREYYKPTGKRLMPVRWMSPESLRDGKFTMKSDVWSYGVVLYEIATLGQQPYQGLGNDEVLGFISAQNTMAKPRHCSDFWYNLMKKCWKYDPRDRPTFYHLVHYFRLNDHLPEEFVKQSFVFQEPYAFEHLWESPYNFDPDVTDIAEPISSQPIAMNPNMFPTEEEVENEEGPICLNNRNRECRPPNSASLAETANGGKEEGGDEELDNPFCKQTDKPLISKEANDLEEMDSS
uniref:receptor protein-tyrosine kinase n=1 Tax=Steinernema glaseri TaxID=37863 RepID=A0A1I7ZCD6_9BILA